MRKETVWALRMGVAAVALAALADRGRAELPPSAYREYQKKAPEFVKIRVESVKTDETDTGDVKLVKVVVEAKVVKVERSRSGLEKGDRVRIEYTRKIRKEPFAGPSEVPLVKKGKEYPAFLKKKAGRTFTPAAGGFTFKVVGGG